MKKTVIILGCILTLALISHTLAFDTSARKPDTYKSKLLPEERAKRAVQDSYHHSKVIAEKVEVARLLSDRAPGKWPLIGKLDAQDTCMIQCPPGGYAEGEPDCGLNYEDTYNGGCNSNPEVFQAVASGDTICGTSGTFIIVDGDTVDARDTDWFELEVTDSSNLRWGAVAEFPLFLAILDGTDGCSNYVLLAYDFADPCDTLSLSVEVGPGTYWFFIAPNAFGDTPFNCPVDYVAWVHAEATGPAPCEPDVVIGDLVLPYEDLNATTCGFGFDHDETCLGPYDGGEDILYEFDVTAQMTVDITMDPHGTEWTGMLMTDTCPPDTNCLAYSVGSSGIRRISDLTLPAGTYYLMIDTQPLPYCIPEYDLIIGPPRKGDTCEDPLMIPESFPYVDSSTTSSLNDDCDITGSDGKDAIYELNLTSSYTLTVSLCGSSYDTKLSIYADSCCSGPGNELYYNDNYCGAQSEITGDFEPGLYYIVVDGYGSACGDYVLSVAEYEPCLVQCPVGEEYPLYEPDCHDNYVDTYNGGCNSEPPVFQAVAFGDAICATSGVYACEDTSGPYLVRDTDWYEIFVPGSITLKWCAVSEGFDLLLYILKPGPSGYECDSLDMLEMGSASECDTLCLSVEAERGHYWLFAAPAQWVQSWECPVDYVAWVNAPYVSILRSRDTTRIQVPLPKRTELLGNLPNPFNLTTTFSYALATEAEVTLEMYNLLGRKVVTVVKERQAAGYKSVNWDASNLASGIYFYRLTAGDYTETKRMMLVK